MASSPVVQTVFYNPYDITSWVQAFEWEWQRGQEFEATFYERNPTPVKPYSLDNDVVMDRLRCLKPLSGIHVDTQFFEWMAAKLDRLILSGEESDELLKDVPMLVNLLLAHDRSVRKRLSAFCQCRPVTASWWFWRMMVLVHPHHRPYVSPGGIDKVFQMVALHGLLSDLKPSLLAVGMLMALLGNDVAKLYTFGYPMTDLRSPRDYMICLLNMF